MYHNILVPIDGSITSQRGLLEAIRFAKSQGGQLRLFHMISELVLDCGYSSGTFGDAMIESAREGGRGIMQAAEVLVRREGLQPEAVMVESMEGSAAASILSQAEEWPADLIVMGTHGRHGFFRLTLGSDAEAVVRQATVPVLLVHNVLHQHHRAERCGPVARR